MIELQRLFLIVLLIALILLTLLGISRVLFWILNPSTNNITPITQNERFKAWCEKNNGYWNPRTFYNYARCDMPSGNEVLDTRQETPNL